VNNTNQEQYHIKMKTGDVGRYVLLPGDPGRCKEIAKYFDNPVLIAENREFITYTGYLLGEKVSVTSTGIGCPSTAIAVEELFRIGADTFIRVGTAGIIDDEINFGDLVIVSGAIRDEGTSINYLPIEFPAIANIDIVKSLEFVAKNNNIKHKVGITQSKDSFFAEHSPDKMGDPNRLLDRWNAWKIGKALCSEMESSALFIISSMLGARAGGIMLIQNINSPVSLKNLIETSINGLKQLIINDKENE
jgi:uridine phosphorylase